MQLTLTAEEARLLRECLRFYLPGLRREAAATNIAARELRHELVRREDLCERLLGELDRTDAPPVPAGV